MEDRGLTAQTRGPGSNQIETVRVWLLGGFKASVGSRVIEPHRWRLRKAAALVKLLALAPGHVLHRERVTDVLWPDLDAKPAANNLHRALHVARRAFEDGPTNSPSRYLMLHGDLLALCPEDRLLVDVEVFEEAAETARRSRNPAAYEAAIELYPGELLPEDLYAEWTQERREGLRILFRALLHELATLHEESGEYGAAIGAAERAVSEEPANEEAHLRLVRLHALAGRRGEALARYERLREALARELGTEPSDASRKLYEELRAGRLPSASLRLSERPRPEASAGASPRHNLPVSLTSFVGRKREMPEVKRQLSMSRLLTLTGAGGCGKTRLALEVARDLAPIYPDGAWLVELAPLMDPALVPRATASALGIRKQPGRSLSETLSDHLRSSRMLLVLDNCEHLIDACAEFADRLLGSCEHLRILATSRETLGVPGEVSWPVLPLAIPDAERLPPVAELGRYEAVGLFLDRAGSRAPGFSLTPQNAAAVAEVCGKLDGIPLAIELTAARMRALSVEQIADRLSDSLGLLTSGTRTTEPRHQTLRATLEWSYHLLDEPERRLFGRLSVFAGGWTLEAAEGVCSGDGIGEEKGSRGRVSNLPVLDLLEKLVDKSLVAAGTSPGRGGALRYRMLEPLRQYALEKLRESGEASEVRRRHAEYYLAYAEKAEPELLGGGQGEWVQRLRIELGNLRGALSWSMEPGAEAERAGLRLRLVAALWRFWDVESFEEGKQWLQVALEKDSGGFPAIRAKALGELGWILLFQRDYGRAIPTLEEAIALYRDLGDESGAALALGNLGYAVLHGGYRERVPAFVEEAEALMRGDLDGHTRAFLRMTVASAAMEEGDLESTVAQLEENLKLCRELGDLRSTSMSLFTLGMAELKRDDLERGAALLEEGTRITRDMGNRLGGVYFVWGLGKVAALRGDPERAARLWGAAEALREQMGMSLSYFDLAHSNYERDLASARAALGEEAWEAAWAEGRTMTPDQAVEHALNEEEKPRRAVGSAPRRRSEILTRREREVANLVGRGLANRQIAVELEITERTVEAHVGNVLRKIGLRSRTQIAAWILQRGSPDPADAP